MSEQTDRQAARKRATARRVIVELLAESGLSQRRTPSGISIQKTFPDTREMEKRNVLFTSLNAISKVNSVPIERGNEKEELLLIDLS